MNGVNMMKKILPLQLLALFILLCSMACADSLFEGMTTYEVGQYKVGLDMKAGEYVVLATDSIPGYFCVSSDPNGNDILFNEGFDTNSIIEVRKGEYVELSRCLAIDADDFYSQYTINDSKTGVMLKVGYDISPGEYKLIAESGTTGYYCIYDDARQDDIISNDNFKNSSYVSVMKGQYLVLNRCTIQQ